MLAWPSEIAGSSAPLGGVDGFAPTADHVAAILESQRLAAYTGRVAGSADALLALIRVGGAASRLLQQRGITPGRLEAYMGHVRPEAGQALKQLEASSYEIARELGTKQVSSLHLLLAILRNGKAGLELLRASGHDPARVRSVVMRALTGPGQFGDRHAGRDDASVGQPAEQPRRQREDSKHAGRALVGRHTSTTPSGWERTGREATGRRLSAAIDDRAGTALPPQMPPELVEVGPPAVVPLHRERELGRLLDLVRANPTRIPCVIGDPGSGRSTLIEALSQALDRRLITPTEGPAGASPGAWLQTLHRLAPPDRILVLDGVGAIVTEGSDGPAQLLAAARAGRRWVLVATPADVRRFEIHAAELATSLEPVSLASLAPEALLNIIEAGLAGLTQTRELRFAPTVARTLLRLSARYPSDRAEPGRAMGIADLAAARAQRLAATLVSDEEVAAVVGDAAAVTPALLLRTDDDRYRRLDELLSDRIVGHDKARSRICDLLRRSYAGFRGRRPLASVLLLGPTGVGKTETARALADALFDGESALIRIDLSEYNEPHSVARLIGAPPGYVAYEEGGQLTEAIRRQPASVILLDEFEKAHREVLLLLLQVLEDGRLTDGRGRTVDFSAAALVMTSNLGSELYRQGRTPTESTVLALARSRLPNELWNRFDEVLCYGTLGEAELRAIVTKVAESSSNRLYAERGIGFTIDKTVVDKVLCEDLDRSLGARPLRRAFERLVEGPLANHIVTGQLKSGMRAQVSFDKRGELLIAVAN